LKTPKKPLKWSPWKVIAEIGLDTASILICDPCYVIPENSELAQRYGKDWHKFVDDYGEAELEGAPKRPELPTDDILSTPDKWKEYLKKDKEYREKIRRFKRKPFNLKYDAGHKGLGTVISTGADGMYFVEMRTKGDKKEIRIKF
jgi:hypothetical protein